jgi:hypothetical protein
MKLDKADYRVLILLILIVIAFTSLFYIDINKKIDIGDREVIGTIHFKNNIVQRKLEDQVVWETLENNSPLTNKDTIRSEAFSDAIIRLKDGTEINIDENSMFNLDLSGDKPSLEFSQGSMQVKNGTSKQSNLVIKSQGSEIDVGTGNLKIEKEAKKDLSLFVENGTSKITHNGKQIDVESGKKAALVEGSEVTVKKIPVRLHLPASQQLYLAEEGRDASVSFEWEADHGFSESLLEVSRSPLFKLQLIKHELSGNHYRSSLKEGTYYWRVLVKDPKSNKWESSDTGKFFVAKDEALRLDNPSNNTDFSYVTEPPLINFSWPKISTARGYKFELSDTIQFTHLVKSIETEVNTLSFDDLAAGEYHWRVTAHSSFPGSPDKKAGPSHFKIKKNESYPAPHLIRPSNGTEITLEEIQKGQAIMIWEGNPELVKYKIEISKDPKFGSTVLSKENTSNFFTPNWKEYGQGTFYSRVRGIASDGKEGEVSPVARFSIVEKKTPDEEPKVEEPKKEEKEKPKPPPLELISPFNTIVEMKGKHSIEFIWKGGPGADKYEFVLYQIAGPKRIAVFRSQSKSSPITIRDLSLLDEGPFSWELIEYREGEATQSRKGNFIISLDQLKTLKSIDIEFISPKRLYKEGKH